MCPEKSVLYSSYEIDHLKGFKMPHDFEFKGACLTLPNGGTCKFLLFLLNGDKEISMSQATRYGFVANRPAETLDQWSKTSYQTELPVVKVFLQEQLGFGKERFCQSFFLALGKRLEKQVVTIKPRSPLGQASGLMFRAEATFLKKSEALALLHPDSLSYRLLQNQHMPPVSVLKEICSIERIGAPQELKINAHGAVRKLRMPK